MIDDVPRDQGPRTDRPDHSRGSIPARAAPSAYQSALLRIIASTTNDPAQLRGLVYDSERVEMATLQAPHDADDPAFPAWLARPQSQNARTGRPVPGPLRPRERWLPSEPAILRQAKPLASRSERPQVEIVYPGREN